MENSNYQNEMTLEEANELRKKWLEGGSTPTDRELEALRLLVQYDKTQVLSQVLEAVSGNLPDDYQPEHPFYDGVKVKLTNETEEATQVTLQLPNDVANWVLSNVLRLLERKRHLTPQDELYLATDRVCENLIGL